MICLPPKRKKTILYFSAGITTAFFCLLLAQFFRLQVIEHLRWKKRAESQHYFVVKEPFRRGTFYANCSVQKGMEDRQVPLVIDVPLYHLYADPKGIPQELHKELQQHILRILSPPLKDAMKMGSELSRKSRSRRLVSWISEEQKNLFLSWWRSFAKKHHLPSNALFFVLDFKRFHPMGRLLGQVLHTIQERRDESTGCAVPTGGLELSLHKVLEGSVGFRRLMRSPHNSLETGEVLKKPVHGADVELTINHCIQAIVEEELEKGVKFHKAKGGTAVMVDPKTGHVLALAQYPFFFPDDYQRYFNSPELAEHSKIKALSDAPEPGSPMKVFTVTLALKANRLLQSQNKPPIFHILEKIPTSPRMFPGRPKPITDVHASKFLNMYMGIQRSSNVYMATLASRVVKALGEEWYRNELYSTFGLGQKTGVELVGESSGMLPHPKKVNAAGRLEWSKGTPYTIAMGYNVQTTALQMARAYSALANGGVLPTLTIIRKVFRTNEDGTREILLDNTKEDRALSFKRVIEREDLQEIVKAMKFTTKTGGSALKADVYGYTEAGKTGTSMKLVNGQYTNKAHVASFVGFAPVKDPAFVICIRLDEPAPGFVPGLGLNHRGGTCTTSIFREIATRTLELLGVPMDDPFGFPAHDPRGDAKKADWYEETEKLNQLYTEWNK